MTWRAVRKLWGIVILLTAIPEGVAGQHILIVYYSRTGHTALLADAVASGARGVAGSDVRLLPVDSVSHDDVAWADALIVGSPVHAANISVPIMAFLDSLPLNEMHDKIGAAFVTAGGISAGEETVQLAILRAMLVYKMIVVGGPTWKEAFGASAVTIEPPFTDTVATASIDSIFAAKGSRLGARVAEVAKLLSNGGGTQLSVAFPGALSAQAPTAAALEQWIRSGYEFSWKSGEPMRAEVRQVWSQLGSGGVGYGFRTFQVREGAPDSVPRMEYWRVTLDELHTSVVGSIGLAWGVHTEEFKVKGQPPETIRVRFTNTLRWNGHQWENLLYHRDAQVFGDDGTYMKGRE